MSEDRHAVKVTIYGNEYTIRGEAQEGYIQTLARYVDEKMKEIGQGTSLTSPLKISILAAINIADEVFRLRAGGEQSAGAIAPEAISALAAHIEAVLAEEEL